MKLSTRYLLILCVTAVLGVFILQFFWIRNYYFVNKATFEKEVNLAMEDAVKKEFIVRCDTLEKLIIKQLLDTNEYKVKTWYSKKQKVHMLTILNKRKLSDSSSMHSDSLNQALLPGDTAYRGKIARYIARTIRNNELEGRIIYFHTQSLGNYVVAEAKKFDFDTARLRPILTSLLAARNINTSFKFNIRAKDSTFNTNTFNAALQTQHPVITRAYLTYKQNKNDHYVRAIFSNPTNYIISKLGYMLAGSLVLLLVVSFSLFLLFRSLLTEKRLSAVKNDFISNITHEFKTPIASVSAAVEALSDFDVLDDREKTQRYLTHSKNELQRLSVLVDKVLNSSLYENQAFSIKPEEINIDATIQSILQNQASATPKTVNLGYSNTSPVKIIQADRLYFEHAISNVVDNAIKYSRDVVNINVSCHLRNEQLVIAVQDNGIGINGTNLQMVFEKFYRVPTGNQHKVKGHGLGLNYVKSITERHGGCCKIESEPGKGTTLTLSWPV